MKKKFEIKEKAVATRMVSAATPANAGKNSTGGSITSTVVMF